MIRNFDLRQKKVIDVDTAEVIGYIRDMDIDVDSGRINSVTVPRTGLFTIFKPCRAVTVPWNRVIAIGREHILVKTDGDIK